MDHNGHWFPCPGGAMQNLSSTRCESPFSAQLPAPSAYEHILHSDEASFSQALRKAARDGCNSNLLSSALTVAQMFQLQALPIQFSPPVYSFPFRSMGYLIIEPLWCSTPHSCDERWSWPEVRATISTKPRFCCGRAARDHLMPKE